MRVFLDANVIFSAAAASRNVRVLIGLLLARGHECGADAYVLAEARRNITRKKPACLVALEDLIENIRIAPPADLGGDATFPAHLLPEKDRPVMAAAIHCGCEALVTGDRAHFGALYGQTIGGVAIHSPATLAELLFPG